MLSKLKVDFGVLHQLNDYKIVTEKFIRDILESGLLVDEHDLILQNSWSVSTKKSSRTLQSLKLIANSVRLGTLVLQSLTGDKSTLTSLGLVIPVSLHYLTLKLKKMQESKYTEAFEKLVSTMHKLYQLIRAIDRQHDNRLTSIENLNQNVMRALVRVIMPKMNTYLYTAGKDIIAVTSKLHDLTKKVDAALRTDDFRNMYEVAFEQIDFSLPNLPPDAAYKAFYERCSLSYSLIVSSFLCAIGLGFCCPRENNEDVNCKVLLDEILPEALELVCTSFNKMSEDYNCAYGKLPESPGEAHSQQVVQKLHPINKTLVNFIKKIRLIFDVAQLMQDDLQLTDYANLGSTLEGRYENIENLFFDCQDMLNSLKTVVCRQAKIEQAEAARQREQVAQAEATAIVEEQSVSESAGPSVIRHDDPDMPANSEEYNLSVHGSDDESEKEDCAKPSTKEYTELLDCIKRQKLIIQELNLELKRRKFITQDEDPSRQNKIPTARVLPTKQPIDRRRNARTGAINIGQLNDANLNDPLPGFPHQQNGPLLPFATTFQQAFPQLNFPEQITLPFPPNSLPQHLVLFNVSIKLNFQSRPSPILKLEMCLEMCRLLRQLCQCKQHHHHRPCQTFLTISAPKMRCPMRNIKIWPLKFKQLRVIITGLEMKRFLKMSQTSCMIITITNIHRLTMKTPLQLTINIKVIKQ